MELISAKAYLSQYRMLTIRLQQLENDIAEIRAERLSISIELDGIPRGTDLSDKTGNLAAKLADLEEAAVAKRSELWSKRIEITNVIGRVPDPAMQKILHSRYILFRRWEEIAEELNLSKRHTLRIHGEALIRIDSVLNAEK